MKVLNQIFTDEEFKKLIKAKGKETWHNFLLRLIELEGGKK